MDVSSRRHGAPSRRPRLNSGLAAEARTERADKRERRRSRTLTLTYRKRQINRRRAGGFTPAALERFDASTGAAVTTSRRAAAAEARVAAAGGAHRAAAAADFSTT